MSSERNSGSPSVHPFFDPDSTYRVLTQESFWADGGQRCVRAFFERQLRRRRREQQSYAPPDKGTWESDTTVNEGVRDYLRAVRRYVNKEESRALEAIEQPAGAEPGGPWPRLFTFDLTQSPPAQVGEARPASPFAPSQVPVGEVRRRGEGALFTGIGLPVQPEIEYFRVDIPEVEPGRRCLLLLVEPSLLEHLRGILSRSDGEGPEGVFGQALAEAVPPGAGPEARRLARRLQEAWSCAEGLELTADESGWLAQRVDLARPSRLDPGTCVVLCHGPRAA